MRLAFTPYAWEDYLYWQATDKRMLKRINRLIEDTMRSPFEGIGKPERLSFDFSGQWSRRIDEEHRLIYHVDERHDREELVIVKARHHHN